MKNIALLAAFLLSTLVGCSSSGQADVVLETDTSPLTDTERLNINAAFGEVHELELVGV